MTTIHLTAVEKLEDQAFAISNFMLSADHAVFQKRIDFITVSTERQFCIIPVGRGEPHANR
jgi:hypothetical protein